MRILVFSYDADRGQVFADVVEAEDDAQATARVLTARPYAAIDEAFPTATLSVYLEGLRHQLTCPVKELLIHQTIAEEQNA